MSKQPQSPNSEAYRSSSLFLGEESPASLSRRLSSPLSGDLGSSTAHPISPIANWESLGVQGSDKHRPLKSKSKHNLAAFGAKLSSTAASVGVHASKYKQAKDPKDHLKESALLDTNNDMSPMDPVGMIPSTMSRPSTANISPSSTGSALLKGKMFRQSKSDLKSLKLRTDLGLQAARTSLNERSPMTRGGSAKELDRIAAIGQNGGLVQNSEFAFGHGPHHHHLHHPHISFRKKDSPAAVLSSSASNSTLGSEGTVYSFNTSSSGPTSLPSMSTFKTPEEAMAFLTSSWTLLTLRIQPVFKKEEALRIPVEDVNILVLMHFSTHHWLGGTGLEILARVDELIQTGLKASPLIPSQPTMDRLADSWQYFYHRTLFSLEAIFLPLQLEIDAVGQVFTNAKIAQEYWYPLVATRPMSLHKVHASSRKQHKLSIRRRVLTAYRDAALIPMLPRLKEALEDQILHPNCFATSTEVDAQILQCLTMLAQIRSDDEAHHSVLEMLALAQKSWTAKFHHKDRKAAHKRS